MTIDLLSLADRRLAYQRQVGNKNIPGVLFLSGFASNMAGAKATFLAQKAAENAVPFVRFDYRGCGQSPGAFIDGTIGAWLDDSLAVLDRLTKGPQIVIGSSMGGWLGLLLAKARPERVKAFIGIAPAADFTEDLIWAKLSPAQRDAFLHDGIIKENDIPITYKLIEEGKHHVVLRSPLSMPFPVRLLHGMADKDVPWERTLQLAQHISSDDVRVTLVKNAQHSFSEPPNMELLWKTAEAFL